MKFCPVLLPLRVAAKPDAISGFAGWIVSEECARQCAVKVLRPVRAREGSAERTPTPSKARYGAQHRRQARADALSLDPSAWRAVQMICATARGSDVFRSGSEGAEGAMTTLLDSRIQMQGFPCLLNGWS